jgi:hypothetical protein
LRPPLEWATEGKRQDPEGVKKRRVRAEADADGLSLDGERVLTRSEIAAAYYNPPTRTVRFRPHRSLLRRRRELAVKDEAEAHELLSALHLAPSQSAATYDEATVPALIHKVFSGLLFCTLFIGVVIGVSGWWAYIVGFLLVEIVAFFLRKGMRIGADGVLAGRRFIPWSEVKTVIEKKTAAVLVLESGKRVRLSHREGPAIAERVRQELTRFRGRAPEVDPGVLLARGGRSTQEWLRGLRAATDYRAGSLPLEQLWRIVEDAGAEPDVRAGAAIALRSSLDDEGRHRLHETAMASAAPRVRVALETASLAEDEEELAAALEAVGKG